MPAFEFGPFRLDEPGRLLKLADREVALQPRVFDLLAYLVRHRERVVSKDELLDALWPGVNVTENSLQRAVSTLRSALREGGMDAVLKNYPGKGYRFCDETALALTPASLVPVLHENPDSAPHKRAIAEERWSDAHALYAALNETRALDAVELEQWSDALQCLGRPADAVPVLVRATAAYTEADDRGSAARCAVALSTIHMERTEMAVAKGWVAHAEDLLSATPDATEFGYVLWMQSKIAATEGDLAHARDLADAAYNSGQRKADGRLEALGLMYRGFYRVSLGDTAGGLADQDRAAALGMAQKVDVITGGILYCIILWTSRAFGDWARASQWTVGYHKLYTDCRLEFSGTCQLHHAEVLGSQGSLKAGLSHIENALERLAQDAPWGLGDAYRVLGDLHAAVGHDDRAMEAYETSYSLGWNPEPGYAMLLLEREDAEAAMASLERSLTGIGWWNMQRRGILLAHLALVAAHAGRAERAEALIGELASQKGRWPMPSIRALTNEASAVLAEQRGETQDALRHLQLARQLWASVECRLQAARLRLKIAALHLKLGDRNGARIELRAAWAAAEGLESDKLIGQCRELQGMLA